jgi:hypothetical protein
MGTSAIFLLLVNLAPLADAQSFSATDSMGVERDSHTATLLANGKVLVAGGEDADGSPLNTAEVYDPATGTFSDTGSMSAARFAHTATLLANGKVLVTGGFGATALLASAELYDPGSGTFSATGNLNRARYSHTATLLGNGMVLIIGGDNASSNPIADAELYDPTLGPGTFSLSATLAAARSMHTATLLPNGTVLVAGGKGLSGVLLTSAELFAGNSFSPTTGSLAIARRSHTATLTDGKVLITGGSAFAGAESYDPGTGQFLPAGSMAATPRFNHTATLLNDGTTLVAGGVDGSFNAFADAELHAGGSFSTTGSMGAARGFHTATLLSDGKVLVAGGIGSSFAAVDSAELYSPAEVGEEEITIDIKPGSSTNPVNPKSNGTIPVAILSSATFDASTEVDISTLTFGHTGDEESLSHCGIQNVNADGLMDLMCHFYTQLTGLQAGDTEAYLKFETFDGESYVGSDKVRIVPR